MSVSSQLAPDRGDWHVLWAGVGRGHPLLHQLRQQVDNALLAADIRSDLRPFVPRLTLAPCRDAPGAMVQQWARRHRAFTGPLWPVSSFTLMASEPGLHGSRIHRAIRDYALLAA